jgi:glycosyltransferase involved in cell wall biosynthesis
MPLVSVVIPVYNGERFLKESLESVFAQTFQDYDIVCVDDGSTDGSVALLQQYGSRVRVISQANAGQSAARNAGVRQATGAFVAFLDQDDLWYPAKLAQQVAVLNVEPDVVVVHCNYNRMDAKGRVVVTGAAIAERSSALASPLGRLIGEALVFPSAMMVRRDVFQRVGGFDSELRGFEDFDLIARLKQQGRFVLLHESGMGYRLHAGGFTRAGGLGVIRSRERFLIRMRMLYAEDDEKEILIKQMLADCYSDWGMHEAREGQPRKGWGKLIQALQQDPWKFRTYSRLVRVFLAFLGSKKQGV